MHAETVRMHSFVDGNGRSTRLVADLVFLVAQDAEAVAEMYDWRINKREYIALLREHDLTETPNRSLSPCPPGGSTTPTTGDQIGDQKPPDWSASAGDCR